jgi:hypothetical protein
MSDTVETVEHAFWGRMQRRAGYDGWDVEFSDALADHTSIRIRVCFDDPNDEVAQSNYSAIRRRWGELWPRILRRTDDMKSGYGYGSVPINASSDWFSMRLPTKPIERLAEWSVMLQADEAGWLLDFKGWDDFGGQGVF